MNMRAFHRILASVILLLSIFSAPEPVYAEIKNFSVNSSADTSDADPGNGVCANSSGQCTLRAAMEEAGSLYPAHTVNIGFNLPYPHTIILTDNLPQLFANVVNENLYRVIIDGNYEFGGFEGSSADTTISGLQLQKFTNSAIFDVVSGTDFITNNVIIDNGGSGILLGGSSSNDGTMTIRATISVTIPLAN